MLVVEKEVLKIKKYGSIFLNGPMYYSKTDWCTWQQTG